VTVSPVDFESLGASVLQSNDTNELDVGDSQGFHGSAGQSSEEHPSANDDVDNEAIGIAGHQNPGGEFSLKRKRGKEDSYERAEEGKELTGRKKSSRKNRSKKRAIEAAKDLEKKKAEGPKVKPADIEGSSKEHQDLYKRIKEPSHSASPSSSLKATSTAYRGVPGRLPSFKDCSISDLQQRKDWSEWTYLSFDPW
jgi:hypothetical protein